MNEGDWDSVNCMIKWVEWMCDMAEGNPQNFKKREMVCDECITKDGIEIMMIMMNMVFS